MFFFSPASDSLSLSLLSILIFLFMNIEPNITRAEPCPQASGFMCVATDLCVDGLVVTDGEGILNPRMGSRDGSAYSCPGEKQICCQLADFQDDQPAKGNLVFFLLLDRAKKR